MLGERGGALLAVVIVGCVWCQGTRGHRHQKVRTVIARGKMVALHIIVYITLDGI